MSKKTNLSLSETIVVDPEFHGEGVHFPNRKGMRANGHPWGNELAPFGHHLDLLTQSSHSRLLDGNVHRQSHVQIHLERDPSRCCVQIHKLIMVFIHSLFYSLQLQNLIRPTLAINVCRTNSYMNIGYYLTQCIAGRTSSTITNPAFASAIKCTFPSTLSFNKTHAHNNKMGFQS